MIAVLTRIAEAKAAWEQIHPDQNALSVALGDRVAKAFKATLPEAKLYELSSITCSGRVLGLHVEEDPDLPADAIEVR